VVDLTFIYEDSTDYWYDEGYRLAQNVLHNLSASQWDELCAAWASQSLEWQDRLAYILGDGPASREVDLLIDMYLIGQADVVLRAAEILRGLALEHVRTAAVRRIGDPEDVLSAARRAGSVNELLELLVSIRHR